MWGITLNGGKTLTHYAPSSNSHVSMVCPTNIKWRRSEVVSTNSRNSLRFLQVKMDTMSDGINGDVNNEDGGMFLTHEALRRSAWPKKTKR